MKSIPWLHLAASMIPVLATAFVPLLQSNGQPWALAVAMVLTQLSAFYHGSQTGAAKAVAAVAVGPELSPTGLVAPTPSLPSAAK